MFTVAANLAGIITAIAATITALGGAVVSFYVLIPSLRTNRDTHKIVNQQRTDLVNYQAMLVETLKANGVVVPHDQSKPIINIEEKGENNAV